MTKTRTTEVAILADTPASENQEVVEATAILIEAAKDARLVAVVCTHVESKEPGTILCAMIRNEENPELAQYVPLGMLFTGTNTAWTEYIPPQSALQVEIPSCEPEPEETTEGLGEDPS